MWTPTAPSSRWLTKELLHLPYERECLADIGCNLPLFFGKIAHGMVLQLDFDVSQRDDGAVAGKWTNVQ